MGKSTGMDFLVGVAVGAVIGAAAAILLTPAAGEDTRKFISDKTRDAVKVTKDTAAKVKDKVSEKVDRIKGNLGDKVEETFVEEDSEI